ncbi:hypothetical protein [Winogradskyella sp. A3E31]|uniref:hypothetical protein n=1 Tax=Winogradskyella sp. A3E31 TaxID=3349637 RepID=UPI00398B1899
MIKLFLKAKHWQLFTLMFGLPIVFQIFIMISMFANIGANGNPNPETFFNLFKLFPIVMLLYMGLFFGWFWSIAIGLQGKVPVNIKMKTKKFKIFFFIPLVYILSISIFIAGLFGGIMESGNEPNVAYIGGVFGIIIPLHLLSMFGIFYSMYFVAKTFKTVQLQKEVGFADFAGEFFMIWFYFIGIWILQPKINMMQNEKSEITTDKDF